MPRPIESEYSPYFNRYISLITETDVVPVLSSQFSDTRTFLHAVPDAEETRLHPPYTWTFRQVLGHLIDSERVFAYRALRFSRGDQTPLPSFDEMLFMANADFNRLTLADLTAEFDAVRTSTLHLASHLLPDAWDRMGTASDSRLSVRAMMYIIAGHERHHVNIMRKRLGS